MEMEGLWVINTKFLGIKGKVLQMEPYDCRFKRLREETGQQKVV